MSTMNPGTDTGSLMNHLQSRMTRGAPEPTVGMGATLLSWTDRYAATVIGWDGSIATVQRDLAKVVAGTPYDGTAEYEYAPDQNGQVSRFRRDADGGWSEVRLNRETKRWNKVSNGGVLIGRRQEYRDPCF